MSGGGETKEVRLRATRCWEEGVHVGNQDDGHDAESADKEGEFAAWS